VTAFIAATVLMGGLRFVGCTPLQATAGICNNQDAVVVTDSRTTPGSSEESPSHSQGTHTPEVIYAPDTGRSCDTPTELCLGRPAPADPVEAAGFPAVTLADLASFRPTTPRLTGEPAGFGVVRMPTNFVAAASTQEITGVLLGYPVTVRFVPVSYVFSYGDGQTRRAGTGGVAWTASGSPQFTPTDTSHVYEDRGTYASSVTVEYSAAVDFGVGWQAVDGVVTARTGDYPVQVVGVRTALVEHTCAEDPHAAGCG
jgi:hypothetical protein